MTRKHTWGTLCYYAVAVLLALIALVPFFWMISTSLKSRGALMSIPIEWIPAEPTLDAYTTVFERFPFFQTILNSLFISVSYTVITLFSASLGGIRFTKIRFKGSGFLLGVISGDNDDSHAGYDDSAVRSHEPDGAYQPLCQRYPALCFQTLCRVHAGAADAHHPR